MHFLLVLAVVGAVVLGGASASVCHNATGACLGSGYVCATGQVVGHEKRCNGVEDCSDGTDEYLCDDPDSSPVFLRTGKARRRAVAQGQFSCAFCTCFQRNLALASTSPLFPAAIRTYLDPSGLMTAGSGIHAGLPCSLTNTLSLTVRMYKKTFYCRGPICCMRQLTCDSCTPSFSNLRRCIEA